MSPPVEQLATVYEIATSMMDCLAQSNNNIEYTCMHTQMIVNCKCASPKLLLLPDKIFL